MLVWLWLTLNILVGLHAMDFPPVMRSSVDITAHGGIKPIVKKLVGKIFSHTKLRRCIALAACKSAYRGGKQADDAKADVEAAGFQFIKEFSVKQGDDTDYVGLWSSHRQCLMNFRGSSSRQDFMNSMNATPVSAWGIPGVHAGIKNELEGLIKVMNFSLIRRTCTNKALTVTGHSLGGGLAQLFSLVLNQVGDPLNAGIKVDFLYTFGGMSVGTTDLPNHGSPSGCIRGSQFYTAHKNDDDSIVMDVAKQPLAGGSMLVPIKSRRTLLLGPYKFQNYECGTPIPDDVGHFPLMAPQGGINLQGYKHWSVTHMTATYALNMGCTTLSDYREEYDKFMEKWPELAKNKTEEFKQLSKKLLR